MAKPEKKEEKEETYRYVVGQVPTQTEPMIIDNETDDQYNIYHCLASIMNKLDDLEKLMK